MRKECHVPVESKEGTAFDSSQTIDISTGGVGFVSRKKVPINTKMAIEIDLTPNRPDCLSHLGVARELAALTGRPLKSGKLSHRESSTPTDDNVAELDEAVVLDAFAVTGAAFAGGGTSLRTTGWILDVEGTEVPLAGFVSRPVVVEGDAGTRDAVFEISFLINP